MLRHLIGFAIAIALTLLAWWLLYRMGHPEAVWIAGLLGFGE